jgi:26S proteasome non-ATPase regulatory subunit 9
VLTNDYKALSQQVESLLHQLHSMDASSSRLMPVDAPNGEQQGAPSANGNLENVRPLGVIDEISEGSPAADGGLQLHDKVLKFGNLTSETLNVLQELAGLLMSSEGREIEVLVLRNGQRVRLQVTPKRWEGRGLLGCHLQPI